MRNSFIILFASKLSFVDIRSVFNNPNFYSHSYFQNLSLFLQKAPLGSAQYTFLFIAFLKILQLGLIWSVGTIGEAKLVRRAYLVYLVSSCIMKSEKHSLNCNDPTTHVLFHVFFIVRYDF